MVAYERPLKEATSNFPAPFEEVWESSVPWEIGAKETLPYKTEKFFGETVFLPFPSRGYTANMLLIDGPPARPCLYICMALLGVIALGYIWTLAIEPLK